MHAPGRLVQYPTLPDIATDLYTRIDTNTHLAGAIA